MTIPVPTGPVPIQSDTRQRPGMLGLIGLLVNDCRHWLYLRPSLGDPITTHVVIALTFGTVPSTSVWNAL